MGLRSWRFPSRSSPNISEAVNKESYPLLQRNALTPWRVLRSRRKDLDSEQWRQTSPCLSSLTCVDEPQKIKAGLPNAGPRLSRTLSVPETCSTSLSSGFSSITITARRVSSSGDLSSPESHHGSSLMTQTGQHRPSSTSVVSLRDDDTAVKRNIESSNPPVPLSRKATMQYDTGDRFPANPPPPEHHRFSYTVDSGTASHANEGPSFSSSTPLVSNRHMFRSCAHLDLLPSQSTSSIFFLDKSLSISLGCPSPQEDRQAMHRSTLSLHLGGVHFSSRPGKSQATGVPFRSSSEWNLVEFTCNGKGGQFRCLEDTTTVNSRPTGSDSTEARATLAPLPFRARCHSSSAVVRLNGKANDVSGPLQSSSRRRGLDDSESAVLNTRLDSPVVIRNSSAVVSAGKSRDLKEKAQNSSHSEDAEGFSSSSRLLGSSRENGRSSEDGRRVLRVRADTVLKVQECPVSPHMLNCTCGCNSSNQPSFLSLKEALELFRPDFISRSQKRMRRLEQKTRERRSLQTSDVLGMDPTNRKQNCTKPHPLSDNLFKPKDRVISGKEMQLRSRRIYNKLPEVTKKKEEEKRRMVLQTNRLRAEVFKKKLLDQILQRNSD